MSNNDHLHLAPPKKKTDARVRRTRDALGDALIALMQEKPFDTITREDDAIGMGYMQIDQPGYPGYKLERHRLAYKGGKVVKQDRWILNYRPVVEYVRMGVNPNPNLAKPPDKKNHMPKPAKGKSFRIVQ